MKKVDFNECLGKAIKTLVSIHLRGGVTLKALSIAALAGCVSFSSQSAASAEMTVSPVLDTLHDSGAKIPNSENVYPASEYTLTEVVPSDVNNLPINVIKYYDSNDNVAHYYEISFKHSSYGEGDSTKYFKWAKDGENVKLVETTVASDAVLTIHYNLGDTVPSFDIGENQTIESISEIYLGKDLKNIVGSIGKVGNISSKFIGNTTTIDGKSSSDYKYSTIYTGIGGEIDSISSSFIGNTVNIDAQGSRVQGTSIKVLGDGTVNSVDSEFVGNNVNITSQGTEIHGGLLYVASDGVIGNLTSDFIRNTTTTSSNNGADGAIYGAILRTDGAVNIAGSKFIENRGVSAVNDYLYGGSIYNQGTSNNNGLTIVDSVFVGNSLQSGSTSYGGAIYNAGKLSIENTSFRDNYVSGSNAKGGAIFTQSDMTISANDGKITEFSGNYTLNGTTKDNQAIYVDNSNATVTFSATDEGTIILDDKIDGKSGYNVVLGGDATGTIGLYNSITNANIRANGVNIDMSDGKFLTYDFLSLASEGSAKYSIDVDFAGNRADKFVLGSESRGTIYLNDLNLIGGAPSTSSIIQLITGPDSISIGLSDDLINKYHKVTIRDYGVSDDLTSNAKWGDIFGAHLYKDTIEEGIRTAISSSNRTTADSLEYYVNKQTEDLGVVAAGDTMMLLNQSDKFSTKTFSAKSSSDSYTLGANLGATYGTFSVSGYSSSARNTLDAAGHTMFEIGDGASVNLEYLTINNLADVDGSLMKISQGGSGSLSYVNVTGNAGSAAIVNDGTLTLAGGSAYSYNIFTGGGIKGTGTTTINAYSYWEFAANGLQNTVNNGSLRLNSGTLGSVISGTGTTYINDNQTITTNADNLRTVVRGWGSNAQTSGSVLNLTGGEIGSNIYSVTMNISGDVTVGDNGKIGANSSSSYYTDINISDGASLTTNASKILSYYPSHMKFTNEGELNLTGGTFSSNNGSIYGEGTTNILGDVSISSTVYNKIHVKDGTLTINASSIKNNVVNDSILKLTSGTISKNTVADINGSGKTIIDGNVYAYYTNFNQDLEINSGCSLYTNWNRNFTNILNNGTLRVTNDDTSTDRTSSSSHGKWTQAVSGDGTLRFEGYSPSYRLYIDNEVKIDNKLYIYVYANVYSNADLLGDEVKIEGINGIHLSYLYLTGGTISNAIKGLNSNARLYISDGVDVISNAIISSTSTNNFLNLGDNSTLTISADNLDANASLSSGSNLKLKSGTWDNAVSGTGTVTILSGEEVTHDITGGTGKSIDALVNIENGAKFTASASNLKGTVTNNGSLYLSGLLNRKYSGTGTTYIDETLHVSSGAGFPATFDLNEGTLISDSIATYTFGHTTNNGGLIFNVNAAGTNSDLFNLASTSNAVFDIKDVMFGIYKTPSFANTVKTYQILKGSLSYLTLGETLHKDVHIYDNVRDQLGVNIYQDDPENRYFDDEYLDRITEGDVGARIELATTDNNHDSVKITYGDYVDASHGDRIDLLSDWNTLETTEVRNFNFRTANDVYTSLRNVGVSTAGTLNINGVSTTTTDEDGNTIINRSVIDLAGYSGFDMSSSSIKNVINAYNVEFRNGNGRVFYTYNDTFGTLLDDGTIQGGIVNCLFKNNNASSSGGAMYLSTGTVVHQILNSTFAGNTVSTTTSSSGGGAIYNNSTISNITGTTFEGNSSSSYGGAIYNSGTISNITGTTFAGNSSSSSSGGAIYNNSTISNITGTTFAGNTSSLYGGAIYNYYGTISNITGTIFEGNSSSSGGAICNSGTISNITGTTFAGNSSSSVAGAIYNSGTITEILNSTFKGNSFSSSYGGGAIYNDGTITISARDIVGEDGEIIKGITEFTGNYGGSSLTNSNNYAIYNYTASSNSIATMTFNATNNGVILMNDKIWNRRYSSYYSMPKLILTGDATGTIKLFDTVEGGDIIADSVNINTANSKIQNYTFTSFTSDESAKWTIDIDFDKKSADKFTVGSGTGTMYIDSLNVLGNANQYTKVAVLNKTVDDTTELALKDAVVDIRATLGDTVYSDQKFHQEAGFGVASSKTWDGTSGAAKFGVNDSISQCIDEDLDALSLIASSSNNEIRNFTFRDGSTYIVSKDLENMYKGTLNIIGVEGAGSTIDANGHSLFYFSGTNCILNLSDIKLTGTKNLVSGSYGKMNVSGKETILDGRVLAKTTLNSGNLRFNTDTFAHSDLVINEGTLALDNDSTETYDIRTLTPGSEGKLAIDIDLNAKVSDQISVSSSPGVITVSSIDFINGIPQNGEFVVQVIKNSSSSSLQLALDESIKHYIFDEYSDIIADKIQIDTDFGQTYHNRLYTGTAYGDLYLTKTYKDNDSIGIRVNAGWNDNPEELESLGDTLYLVNSAELSTRNFNSSNSNDVYNLSVNLDKTAAGNLNLNGTLGDNDSRSTINFKNHTALQIGEGTNLTLNNIRLTGARNIINVESSDANLVLNNAFINGNILGSEKFNILVDGTDTTTVMGAITNADVTFKNGGLVIAENTFADDSVSLKVEKDAYVYLNDGDISNYHFSNIDSSSSSKYGLDLDLETRQADVITAEGTGRIVFEKFDIVNRNLSNVDIGEDYTIRILHTSDDSLQLAISETVQMQLAKEYKLGTVHEILKMDEVLPVANWSDKWEVVEGDYDVYGKLRLATTVTTNDSLHLYELRKELGATKTNLGDTLMLVSILETDQARRFWTDTVSTYDLSVDIGEVSSGSLALEGVQNDSALSVIDLHAHKGFKLSNDTEMSASNIEFVNAGYKDGSLFNLSNEAAVLNLDNITVTETASTNAIKNDGTVNFIGGRNILYSGISGLGVTNINSATLNLTEGLSITQEQINVGNNGILNVQNDSQLFGALTIDGGIVNLANANALTSSVLNDGKLTIETGTLIEDISGVGQVEILGTVVNGAVIAQNVNVSEQGVFTTSADNIGGVISNDGILNLTGTLRNVIQNVGTTNVDKTLTLAKGAGIEGTLNLNDGFVSTHDGVTATYQIGKMLNEGTFDIDVDLSGKVSDLFNVGNDSEGLVYLETINFMNSTSLNEGESFTIQVLETNGTNAIQIALSDALKAERIAVGTVSEIENDLRATVSFDEKFHDSGRVGTIYATLSEGTTKTENDSIKLSYSGIEWGEAGSTERKDTLKELTQYDTDEDKNFNFKTSKDVYTVVEDLGEATDGVLNINGVSDGSNKSKIDLNDHLGFELPNDTTLNLSDVELGGAKDDKLIVVTNPDAVINIENGTLNGDIDGNDTAINISGDEGDTTILNGVITDSDTTLDGGTLKFNPKTFGDEDDSLTINTGRVDVQDDKVDKYEINKLTSSEEGRYSVDVDLSNNTSDKFELTDTTSSGTVYIDDINFINGDLPKEFKTQILDTNGNDDIQIKLSDEIKNTIYDFGTVEKTWDDLQATINFDEKFHDYTQIGDIKGSIKEATTATTNDSIELVKNAPIWRDEITSQDRLDTLHEISAYETEQDKSFNFKTSEDIYGSKADVGLVAGTLSVNGVSDGDGNKSEIDLSGYSGFELDGDTTLNLKDVEISHGKNNTLITSTESGSVVNIENNTLTGNILGKDTVINITGDANDTTILNGVITDSDTTLNGGTLQFNTDTFEDKDDTLTVNSGRVNIQDGSVDTYDITKLTSSDSGRYSIDVDLSSETADKLNLTDKTSSGTVYIDDIRYLNGDLSKEFLAQVLETNGNNNIQIKLSEEIKSQLYDFGTTEKNWNDLKGDVNFDELFHDFHQEGVLKGSIIEATSKTTNDSIALKVHDPIWGEIESVDRLDTLHEVSVYDAAANKTFNFKTSGDKYTSKADVGTVNGTLSVNGVSDSDGNKSEIDLSGNSGFELKSDTVLNLTDVEIGGGKSDNLVIALAPEAVVNIENGTMNGNIRGNDTVINISGTDSDTTILNGVITDSDTALNGGTLKFNTDTFGDKDDTLTVNAGRVDVQDSRVDTYDINKLTSSENGKYSIDVDLSSQKSDKFDITDTTSSGTVYIDSINYINGELPSEFTVQVLDTKGNNDIQIKLSDEIKDTIYDFGTTERNWDDLKANVDFDELFHDYSQIGDLKGTIKEATTNTTNDSISLKMDAPIWHDDISVKDRLDTLHEISSYETESDKSFNFKTSGDEYTSKADVGSVNGTLSVNGVSDGEERSSIDLNGHGGFELNPDTVLNLTDLEMGNGKDNTLISSQTSGGIVNIENNTLNGDILGNNTVINISGDSSDTTTLNGAITGSDTTLTGGTLKFNPDTFGDKDDTLTIEAGRVDVQDSKIDTYDITKLTSSEEAKYSIDIDLSAEKGDKLNITDKTSSGVVYIDEINYINGELPTEFVAQILDTNGNANIQIKLSDEIKEKIYDFGKTERNWNDLKADVDFDEIFHDFHQEGDVKGSIKEATTQTENDSISLKMDAPIWGEIESVDRLDTLHEISVYDEADSKTFNFKTSDDEYSSKADAGTVNGELSINGVKKSGKLSKINLKKFKGFNLVKDSKLNINSTRLSNGSENVIITASDASAEVTLNNSQVDGVIKGVDGYTVNITGDKEHIFDVRNSIENAKINIDTVQLDFYKPQSFATSDVYVNSGTLNLTADRVVSDLEAKTFTINGTFKIMADADLKAQTMDKLPSNTTISNDAYVNVSGINLLSDTTASSVAIPFAYKGFKDNVKYSGNSELSYKTQITTAYAPIFKYDISYENRDDMGYFVFSRHGANGGNNSSAYNPAVLASPVATQAAGQSTMNEAFRYVFEHADAFTQLPSIDRLAAIKANQTALSTDFNHNLGSLCTEHNNKAGWYRPYSTFETVNLNNGPKVHSVNYGSLVGYDSDFRSLKNGWTNIGTGYIGYNGSQLRYDGVSTTMNGGLLGITETFYKGNFWTALTATAGAGVAETHTMYGKEDSTMLMAGIGSKTGYNFEFKEGKYILQPIMFMSYTFVNTFDYTNSAGVRIENDPMHTVQLNPNVRFIANLPHGWQPYASVGMVWNLMNESSSSANGVKLPEMHTKPYIEYGVGLQKNMKDRFTAFGQAMIRNGGRTGIALTAGFRWALGKDHDHNHEHQEVKDVNGVRSAEKGRTILKQMSQSQRSALGLKPLKDTTITSNGATLKKLN